MMVVALLPLRAEVVLSGKLEGGGGEKGLPSVS